MSKTIHAPLCDDEIKTLKSGDYVYITGTIYSARDAAHLRMYEAMQKGEKVPMPLENQVIYYMGPSPAREGRPIGSAGPTTSSQVRAIITGQWVKRHDWQGETQRCSQRSYCAQWLCLFCSRWRRRCIIIQSHQIFRSHCIR